MKRIITMFLTVIILFTICSFSVKGYDPLIDTENDYTYMVIDDGDNGIHAEVVEYSGEEDSLNIPEKLGGYIVDGMQFISIKDPAGIKNISIPDTIKYINYKYLEKTQWYADETDDYIYLNHALVRYNGNEEVVVIRDDISVIGAYAFQGNDKIKSIIIPETVKYINSGAFSACENLENVYYISTQEKWEKIEIDSENDSLLRADISFQLYHGLLDADFDGEITISDSTYIQLYLARMIDETMINLGDSSDQQISIVDATRIQQHLARLINLEA